MLRLFSRGFDMKWSMRTALAGVLVVCAAAPSRSQIQSACIGLFADTEFGVYCVFTPLQMVPVHVFFHAPTEGGAIAVEFDVAYPANVIPTTRIVNCGKVDCSILVEPFYAYRFLQCRFGEWILIWRQDVFLMTSDPSEADIVPAPGLPAVRYASCEPGYPLYPATVWRNMYFNWCRLDAVEASTWGSMKSLYLQ